MKTGAYVILVHGYNDYYASEDSIWSHATDDSQNLGPMHGYDVDHLYT